MWLWVRCGRGHEAVFEAMNQMPDAERQKLMDLPLVGAFRAALAEGRIRPDESGNLCRNVDDGMDTRLRLQAKVESDKIVLSRL